MGNFHPGSFALENQVLTFMHNIAAKYAPQYNRHNQYSILSGYESPGNRLHESANATLK